MIKKRSEQHPKVLLLYDIACLLLKHLKVSIIHQNVSHFYYYIQGKNREDLMNFFEFAIPVFHSYGHKMECQVNNIVMEYSGTPKCGHPEIRTSLVINSVPMQCKRVVFPLKLGHLYNQDTYCTKVSAF